MSQDSMVLTLLPGSGDPTSPKAILSVKYELSAEEMDSLYRAWDRFIHTNQSLLIVNGEVRTVDVEMNDGELRIVTP